MKDNEINIAVAEACGWTITSRGDAASRPLVKRPPEIITSQPIPDYCHDLNAMHEAEKILDGPELALMKSELVTITVREGLDAWVCFHATARQRAEAFLRVKGLWNEPTAKDA